CQHRVAVDAERIGEAPRPGQAHPRAQSSRADVLLQGLGELEEERLAARWVEHHRVLPGAHLVAADLPERGQYGPASGPRKWTSSGEVDQARSPQLAHSLWKDWPSRGTSDWPTVAPRTGRDPPHRCPPEEVAHET